jgi:SpoIID/LytB domain protein
VLGPFASYESAEAAARTWAAAGHQPVIARPADWEVWAPADVPDPPGLDAKLVERSADRRLHLELRRPQGTLVLKEPVRLKAPGGLRWGEGIYRGPFRLLPDAHGGWTLLEEVPLERYLEGVVPHEIGAGSPPAALGAQAVLARTWAVRNRGRYQADGYHLCADTQCQVYSDPGQASPAVRQAIAGSRGQVLAQGDHPIHAVYHASNGGVAAGLDEAWSVDPVPYLRPFADGLPGFQERTPLPISSKTLPALLGDGQGAYGADHPLFRWQRTLTSAGIQAALGARGLRVGTPRSLKVLERGASGRVVALEVIGSTSTVVLRRDAIRRTLRQLPSTLFTLSHPQPETWVLKGGGFGHGAGLSQAGAIDLARRGWTMEAILKHYYPGASLQPLETLPQLANVGG